MKNIYFFFVFKYNFRKNYFNNFIKINKIKNFKIFDLSGPFKYYFFGKVIIYLIQKFNFFFKNNVLISCDANPLLTKNSINIWFGGTSHKIPHNLNELKNNCHVFDNFIKYEENLLKLYPHKMSSFFYREKPKIIFIGDFTLYNYSIIDKIWLIEKANIFKNFKIIDSKIFWKKYNLENHKNIQSYYIAIKDLLRFNLIIELSVLFEDKLIVVGNKWKQHIQSSLKSNYNPRYIKSLYKGNICLDFGSKWGNNCLYPRSTNIIESGGILLQSTQSDTAEIFLKNNHDISYNSIDELSKIIKILLSNIDKIKDLYNSQYKIFNNDHLNYNTLKKIFYISKKNN